MKFRWLIFAAVLLAGCAKYPTKEPLHQVMQQNDPASMKLEQAFNAYVDCVRLDDGTETGIIHLKDGTSSKYWFRSHHMCKDMGGTWFLMSDGKETYMAGWFCCEVQLPEKQMESLADLRTFIRQNDGDPP